jgi:hypothetical protein
MLTQTFSEQEDLIVFFIFTNYRKHTYAKLHYITLKLDEVYITFFIETCSYLNRKEK